MVTPPPTDMKSNTGIGQSFIGTGTSKIKKEETLSIWFNNKKHVVGNINADGQINIEISPKLIDKMGTVSLKYWIMRHSYINCELINDGTPDVQIFGFSGIVAGGISSPPQLLLLNTQKSKTNRSFNHFIYSPEAISLELTDQACSNNNGEGRKIPVRMNATVTLKPGWNKAKIIHFKTRQEGEDAITIFTTEGQSNTYNGEWSTYDQID